ncbi:MAG: MFS transporter [Anaerolineales bacterium]|nr:MFS transporter [Anaerolineales bacterium]
MQADKNPKTSPFPPPTVIEKSKDLSRAFAQEEIKKNLRHNFIVNLADGGFFGAALGFASFVTVIPLFVSTLTDSAVLIGLIPAIHAVGWQLPQLLTADRVARLRRYRPTVLFLTFHERAPYLGLAIIAWFLPVLEARWALAFTYLFLVWQGLGGGITATAWQSLIGRLIPLGRLGTFFGAQSATANLMASGSAVMAGILLERLRFPNNFTVCFLLASLSMIISWFFLAKTREPEIIPTRPPRSPRAFINNIGEILHQDINFRWFLFVRMLSQLGTMAFAFYTVYAVRILGVSEGIAGILTGILMATQIAANPILGWIGDRFGHRLSLEIGIMAAVASAGLAWLVVGESWFYLIFGLAGIANVALWTTPIAISLQFGNEDDRPIYIGMANTLIAPVTFLAPVIGGLLADHYGYQTTFIVSAIAGLVTVFVLHMVVKNPKQVN